MSEGIPDLRSTEGPERREDGTFAPGRSPNPGGQAAWLKPIRDELRKGSAEAVTRLRRIVAKGSDKDANIAAKVLLEFAVPKPKQTHHVKHSGDPLAPMSPEELRDFVLASKKEGGK